KFESLDYSPSGIELLAVKEFEASTYATVFVPEGKISYFIKKIEKYSTEETNTGKFKNKDLVESIAEIRKATLEGLWTDDRSFLPKEGESIWWEVWIRSGKSMLDFFLKESGKIGLEVSSEKIIFPDRTVILAYGDIKQVIRSVDLLNCIAEVRKAKDTPEIFTRMTPAEQKEWVEEAAGRITPAPADAVAICLLDTGINKGHPLIDPHLSENNMHAYNPDWLVTDHRGHGTEMAGLALYGDLMEVMATSDPITLHHRLESVKILPPPPEQNDPKLYGAITKECVARAELSAPHRQRVISTAVTSSNNRGRGQPCSWSAEIDQLCSGAEDGLKRLFIVSAGNTDPQQRHLYPKSNETDGIHDPAQAWNVLSVGAHTDKVDIDQNEYPGWKPIAPAGDLSPSSCTSMVWQRKKWPIKPDVVFEGGNSAKVPIGDEAYELDSLQLLTTHWLPIEKLLTVSGDTSAATSLASRMAATLQAEYPEFWPETIRALLVHSAEWSPAMKARFNPLNDNKENLLRYCGFGAPDSMKALRSAANSLTLIAQDELQPFDRIEGRYKTCDMHLHSIPWPEDVLQSLGETDVDMKVTLSYLINDWCI
ncbi:MAG: S8 family peptidase, partial [Desulfobacterales bacterium]|nr:S8 family peptidase [Desulfobacterales bacterium]